MREKLPPEVERGRLRHGLLASNESYGKNGAFRLVLENDNGVPVELDVIASDGGGWDHVSVSTPYRCPMFDELSWIKDLFWNAEETVVHFWPKISEYVNCHPYTLHLWKKQGQEHELPPSMFVGPT